MKDIIVRILFDNNPPLDLRVGSYEEAGKLVAKATEDGLKCQVFEK